MSVFTKMPKLPLTDIYKQLNEKYNVYKASQLKLDMSRGKPCKEQLDLSMGLLNCLGKEDYISSDNTDCRNYGIVDGIQDAKLLFAQLLEVSPAEIIIGGNSSLNMMYDVIARALLKGVPGVNKPWVSANPVKFLCPSPGYDRHFAICEYFGIQMIALEMKEAGPDMDLVEELAASDAGIKGIWCSPQYSNPEGKTYSDEVVERLAAMKTKAGDFRIFWDNAYLVHHLTDDHDSLKNILQACKEAGNPDRVFIFSSTSKISFPGAGVAMLASSESNIKAIKKEISIQTIGPDKINQLRHVRFFKSIDNIKAHMKKHAAIIKPKFDLVLDIFEKELGSKEIAWWNKPRGGYFISLNTLDGCASQVVARTTEAGLILTNAGAAYPYGKDPLDRNIRIAPTFPPIAELRKAVELLCVCVQLVSIEKVL